MAEPISLDLIGREYDPVPVSWQEFDVQLYALAVGCRPEHELDFLYENRGPKVLPTFAVIPALNVMSSAIANLRINLAMLLHGEQQTRFHRALPSRFQGQGQARIASVEDKGKAAVLAIDNTVSDDQGPLYTTRATLYIRGAGGFDDERRSGAAAPVPVVPERNPDVIVEDATRPEQAALYRLTGDRNPIHIDPQFAQMAGFKKPFLHGLCSYGFAGRAILKALCDGDPARLRSLNARFSDQVYPGDELITRVWRTGNGEAVFSMATADGREVLNRASATWEAGE